MEDLTQIPQLVINLFGLNLVFNVETIIMTWIVMALLIVFAFFATRRVNILPGPVQVVGELIVGIFYDLSEDGLGKDVAKRYFPLICSLFMFLFLSNSLGIIPMLSEPTKDLNTPLGFGVLGFIIAHATGIQVKGLKGYLSQYVEPMWWMAPLNVISELSKVVSISFRLYGNILGGSIIILVVSYLVYSILLPPFLNLFFGLFVGTIQAFVFTMLTLVYISLQVK